jgi:hypothetical protein
MPLFDPPSLPRPTPAGIPETSIEAHERVKPHKRAVYAAILGVVQARGPAGATVLEIAAALAKKRSTISGRLTELWRDGRLWFRRDAAGEVMKREGARVYVMPK